MRYDFHKNEFVEIDAIASNPFIIGTDETISFIELHHRFLKLKTLLQNKSFDKTLPVLIYGEKQASFPVAIITLFHLHIPYVGIDSIFPENRVKAIQEITSASLLINLTDTILDVQVDLIIDKNLELVKDNHHLKTTLPNYTHDDLCYILFTSGSTGLPKGVQITRSAFLNFFDWYITWPILNKDLTFMNQATFSFDVYLCDFIGAFYFGALLVLNDLKILKNSAVFIDRFSQYQATTLFCTPSFISMYLTLPNFIESQFPHFKHLVLMGEEVSLTLVKKIKKAFPTLKIINSYGPTEATIVVTYIEITDNIINNHKTIPIGYCKPNSQVLIQNESNNPEELGELVIVGDNVSIGYCNRPELNEDKFFIHKGKRAYKTGDAAYIIDDLIFFNGRLDNQVKLNGYRIELDEITAVLLKYPEVLDATTLPLKSGNVVKKIISFITLKNKSEVDMNEELKQYLNIDLPVYMVPSEIITIKELPVNSNYKIDSKALTEFYLNK